LVLGKILEEDSELSLVKKKEIEIVYPRKQLKKKKKISPDLK